MLLYLTNYLAQFESGFNVFSYLTMRAILGALTALVLSFVMGPRMIKKLSTNQIGQPVREDVFEIRPKQRADNDRAQDHCTAHRRSAGL